VAFKPASLKTLKTNIRVCAEPTESWLETKLLAFQIIVAGIAQGCVYGLIALGFVLIYKATETVNFAQGELMMLGAFAGLACMGLFGLPFWLAFGVSVLAMAIFGVLVERLVIRPVLGQPALSIVMLTFGLGYIARGAVTMIPGIGTDTRVLAAPYKGLSFGLGGVALAGEQLVIIAVTAGLCAVLWMLFRFTRIGIAMQASSQNQLAAYYMGIPVQRLNGLVWGLAAAVAAAAGMLLAPITFVHVNMGFIGLKAFPAAIVGGFGSLPGAIVGGLIIGLVESLSGFYLPEGFKDVVPYVVVLLMLALKPTGLFGERARKKV
jgi:branched-chain amino acid transport system permease protein